MQYGVVLGLLLGTALAVSAIALTGACVGGDPSPASPPSSTSSGGSSGSAETCDGGGHICNGSCIDTASDHSNCGACGKVCSNTEVCDRGNCTTSCSAGARCEPSATVPYPRCVDVASDPENCGACGNVCSIRACGGGECARRVFVSSATTTGLIGDGGVASADALCQSLAASAGLTGTYRAWISDDTSTPAARFRQSKSPYALVDGTRVAASYSALTAGMLESAIRRGEDGGVISGATVWTATTPSGTLVVAAPCGNWSNAAGTQAPVAMGDSEQKTAAWTQSATMQSCADPAHVYCFEQ